MKKKKSKLIPLSKLCKKLDAVFSQWIRRKDADKNGNVACYTCGKVQHWKQQQCGHYISRRHYSTRWLESNCKPQDAGCNIFNQGNSPAFALHLIKDYGQDHLEKLDLLKNQLCKMDRITYEEKIAEYEEKIKNLKT